LEGFAVVGEGCCAEAALGVVEGVYEVAEVGAGYAEEEGVGAAPVKLYCHSFIIVWSLDKRADWK
jgi:hypothetical protein